MEKSMITNYIYKNTLKKFYDSTPNIDIAQSENNIDYIKNQFNKITELLEKCQNGLISIEAIELLNGISFNDFLKDKYIIEAVSSNQVEINDSNIFVVKTPKTLNDYHSYFRIIEIDGHYVTIQYHKGKVIKKLIHLTELNSFISLNKVLNDSEYVGYSAQQWIHNVTILYSGIICESENYFTLYKDKDGSLQVYVTDKPYFDSSFFQEIYRTGKNKPYIKSECEERLIDNTNGKEDRAFILRVIEEQLMNQYNIHEEGMRTKKMQS